VTRFRTGVEAADVRGCRRGRDLLRPLQL